MKYISALPLFRVSGEVRTGRLPIREYITMVCDRIDAAEPVIHALLPEPGRRERLMIEARSLERRYPDPASRPPLYGIPIGVKDIFRVDGFPTKCGSNLPADLFEGKESSAVTTLKSAGALILGKTETTEFAFFEPGPTCNPHDPSRTPGGSSSGSAAAVAAGFTPLALGTQTIGSITRPASFCGVYGFKPSFGRIPADGVIPFSESADHIGFFTQDIEGVGLAASLLCRDWNTFDRPPDRSPVIGVAAGSYLQQADKEVLSFFHHQVQLLANQGCRIVEEDLFGNIAPLNRIHRQMIAREFAEVHRSWFDNHAALYRPGTRDLILEGKQVTAAELRRAMIGRMILRERVESATEKLGVDLWLSPSSCTAALPGLSSTGSPLMNLPWTYMGLPTISVPAGTTKTGLPLGLQFAGSFMRDEILIEWLKRSCNKGRNPYGTKGWRS